jgi:hypothetical protein
MSEKHFATESANYDLARVTNIVESRKYISAPGKYQVKVRSVNDLTDGTGKMISLQAFTPSLAILIKEDLAGDDYGKALDRMMLHRIWTNGSTAKFVPQAGETVNIVVEFVTNKQGNQVLGITELTAIPVSIAKNAKGMFSASTTNEENKENLEEIFVENEGKE